MKIPIKVPIISILDGQQIKFEEKLATLKDVCMRALLNIIEGTRLSGEDSFKRFQLAEKFSKSTGSIELTVDEIVFVKKVIGETFGPAVVGPSWQLLEGESEKSKKAEK